MRVLKGCAPSGDAYVLLLTHLVSFSKKERKKKNKDVVEFEPDEKLRYIRYGCNMHGFVPSNHVFMESLRRICDPTMQKFCQMQESLA